MAQAIVAANQFPERASAWGDISLKCCDEPSYTECWQCREKSEITVHVYKNKIKVKLFLLFVQ